LGGRLLGLAESRARATGRARLVLEADVSLSDLLGWYGRLGFFRVLHLPSFYAPGRGAWRLRRDLGPDATS